MGNTCIVVVETEFVSDRKGGVGDVISTGEKRRF